MPACRRWDVMNSARPLKPVPRDPDLLSQPRNADGRRGSQQRRTGDVTTVLLVAVLRVNASQPEYLPDAFSRDADDHSNLLKRLSLSPQLNRLIRPERTVPSRGPAGPTLKAMQLQSVANCLRGHADLNSSVDERQSLSVEATDRLA